jgi:hypothetical protein
MHSFFAALFAAIFCFGHAPVATSVAATPALAITATQAAQFDLADSRTSYPESACPDCRSYTTMNVSFSAH